MADNVNVKFLKGTQANIPASGAINGAFYLTTDTHRLYVGNGSGTCDLLSQSVFVVANVAALSDYPKVEGQFYYAIAENVLCTYNTTQAKYIQINADTDIKVGTAEFGMTTPQSGTNGATITHTIHNVNKAGTAVGDVESSGAILIEGAGDVEVLGDPTNSKIIIQDKPYDINVGTVADDQKSVSVNLVKGTGASAVTAGSFKIGVSGTGMSVEKDSTNDGVVIKSTAVTPTPEVSAANNATAGFDVTVAISGGGSDTANIKPQIKLDSDSSAIDFVNGVATLNVYSKSEVDAIKNGIDGVVYKGVVNAAADLPTTNVQVGWMYKVGTAFGGYGKNDILIANGTETDGVITSNLTWDHIDTSDSENTLFEISSSGADISLTATGGSNAGTVTVEGDGALITAAGDGANKIKISHAAPTGATAGTRGTGSTTSVSGTGTTSQTFKAISGVVTDAAGHVTGVTENTVSVRDTQLSSLALDINAAGSSASNNVATIKLDNTVVDTAGGSKSDDVSFSIGSTGSLSVTEATAGAVVIDLVWGTFGS